mgnify:CR=1 FL=1
MWQPTQGYIHSIKKNLPARYATHKSAELFMELILLHCSRRNRLRLCPKINQEEGNLSQGSKQLLFKYFFLNVDSNGWSTLHEEQLWRRYLRLTPEALRRLCHSSEESFSKFTCVLTTKHFLPHHHSYKACYLSQTAAMCLSSVTQVSISS